VLHLTAYGGRNDSLFHAASIESPAFTPQHNVTHSQYVYDRLLKEAKCADLTCLTNLDAVSFQAAARAMTANTPFRGEKNPPVYLWDPTLDYDFIQDYTLNEINAGHLVRVPTIVGDATNEGINFTPKKVTSWNGAIQFLSDQYTNIGKSEQHSIRQIWQGPTNAEFDGQWRLVASDVYGHMRYICGGLNISAAYATNGSSPTWQYRWNVGAAAHVAELLKIWHNGTTPAGVFVQGYFASFYRTYDPNKYTTTYLQDSGTVLTSPTWEEFGEAFGKRLLFEDEDDIRMETVSETQKEKCNFISSLQLEE
jgi:carboxylesterase type B